MNPITTSWKYPDDDSIYTTDVYEQAFEVPAGGEFVSGDGWVLDEGRTDGRVIYVRKEEA